MINFFDKLITPYMLVVINIVLILAAEYIGGGMFFDKTGLIHVVVIVFVILIIVRILADFAYGDQILKTFAKIQIGFFVFLGLIHIYEYLGLNVFPIRDEIVEFSVLASYLLWFLGNIMALEFMFHTYYKRSILRMVISGGVATLFAGYLIWLNISHTLIELLPKWSALAALILVIIIAISISVALGRLKVIMPIFENYARYAIPGIVFVVLASCSEYSEATGFLGKFGVSATQNLYLSHFPIYAALSLLLIATGKFKRPTGIYADL